MAEIWIPETADPGERYAGRTRPTRVTPLTGRRVVDRCKVPTPDGPCGHAFYEDEPEVRKVEHFKECTERNRDLIHDLATKRHPEAMKPWDPEYAAWLEERREGIANGSVRW